MEEKIVVINIRSSVLKHPRWKRSEKAVRLLKEKIERIAKTDKVKDQFFFLFSKLLFKLLICYF